MQREMELCNIMKLLKTPTSIVISVGMEVSPALLLLTKRKRELKRPLTVEELVLVKFVTRVSK
jgi:hypothetical protein